MRRLVGAGTKLRPSDFDPELYRWGGRLSDEQKNAVLKSQHELQQRRAHAAVVIHLDVPHGTNLADVGMVACSKCAHLLNANPIQQFGYCSYTRRQVGTWHPVQCRAFEKGET